MPRSADASRPWLSARGRGEASGIWERSGGKPGRRRSETRVGGVAVTLTASAGLPSVGTCSSRQLSAPLGPQCVRDGAGPPVLRCPGEAAAGTGGPPGAGRRHRHP